MEKLVLLLLVVAIVQAQNARRRECATFDGGINMCNYQNHEQMVQRLTRLAERFPNLAQMGSVGKSAQGRSLNYIKISNNVNRRSHLEPMFKFVSPCLQTRNLLCSVQSIFFHLVVRLETCTEMRPWAAS